MSVFKNLKSIFVVEDDAPENKPSDSKPSKSKKEPPKPTGESGGKPKVSHSNPVSTGSGKKDDKIINTLFQAIEKSNLNGFDYLEFKQSVKGLEKMVTDEATRFKSAFATASTMGVTMDKLVETAEYYGKVLDKEREQFLKAASEQSDHLIENRKRELQLMLKSMGEKKKLIEQLQKELKSGENKIKTIQDGIDSAALKIDDTKRNFEVSFSLLRQQIKTDVDKIKTYLK